ncbi:MAG: lysoplasmalogenase [Bacteroidia bacterium]|nr:lysoplasmalogenase [Bacteroidia bacterium]MDW8332870.1 lysoplasmalogenase [Bacteroidia bacterium]
MKGNLKIFRVYWLLAFAFILLLPFKPYPLSFLLKVLPIWLCVYAALEHIRGSRAWRLALGLLCCSVGDILLDLDEDKLFMAGLGSFLIGHLFYIDSFARRMKLNQNALFPIAVYLLFAVAMGFILFNAIENKNLVIPVFLYLGAIFMMTSVATLRTWRTNRVVLGAITFMISDTIIALNKFVITFPKISLGGGLEVGIAPLSVMFTYYLAQYWIVKGSIAG